MGLGDIESRVLAGWVFIMYVHTSSQTWDMLTRSVVKHKQIYMTWVNRVIQCA